MKKTIFSIFGGIFLIGLALVIIGFALGGRPGTFTVRDGQFVYLSSRDNIVLGSAPAWMGENPRFSLFNWGYHDSGNAEHGPIDSYSVPAGLSAQSVPFASNDLRELDIEIAAGYVIVKTGPQPSLTVDGTLPYTSRFENGVWYLESDEHAFEDRLGRFFWDGHDLTTTFTIVVPESLNSLDLEIGMGEAEINGLRLDELDISSGMASTTVYGTTARESAFEAGMGSIKVRDFFGDECVLRVGMGSIDFRGNVSTLLDIECSMGSVEAVLPRPASYGWAAEAGMGSISIDGTTRAAGLGAEANGGDADAKLFFRLDCSMGSIDIKFS